MNRFFLFWILSFFSILFLVSCSETKTPIPAPSSSGSTGVVKTPFSISILKVGDTLETVKVVKTGRITASSSLTLTSQWAGEIAKILVKEWQKVKAGATIAVLKDTVNNFDLRLAQAENALSIQDATVTMTTINLDQWVANARIGLDRAKQVSQTLTDKNSLQFDIVVNSNGKTLDAYNQNYRTYIWDIDRLMTQELYDADRILGISDYFKYPSWESYLGVRNGTSFADAKNEWNALYSVRGLMRAKKEKGSNLENKTLNEDLELVGSGYAELQKFTDSMIFMTQNNVVWWGLPQSTQDGWIALWNGYKTQVQWAEAGWNGWRGQTLTFFKGYKNTEFATKLALASLTRKLTREEQAVIDGSIDIRVTYESARIDLKDRVESAQIWLKQAQLTYDNAIRIRVATLAQLESGRRNTELTLDQARRDYAKLRISAPVEGNITKVIANVGQTINVGSVITEFSGKLPQIVLDVDSDLAATLMIGNSVMIDAGGVSLTGTITAVSSISNANLLSTIRMTIAGGEKYIGKSASMTFESKAKNTNGAILLPINAVRIISESEGEINILSASGGLVKRSVKLGKVGDTSIEVFAPFAKNDLIIITDMGNYDPSKNDLKQN